MDKSIRTRFAPSPTGFLHIGGLRTALYAYLVAKNLKGNFILRVEDTDKDRFVEGSIEDFLHVLNWAKIEPDEGVCLKNDKLVQIGDLGPYIQSERLNIYKKYSDELLENGFAYKCFCTKERLDMLREELQKNKQVPKYDRHCLNLKKEDIEKKIKGGIPYVIRLKIPDGVTKFFDEVRGEISYPNKDLDDQVLIKSDGYPTYHMAVVVDDHEMKITHVIRGEEWISSTPKHIILYKAFNWDIPVYAHLPLLLNKDRSKLSKRQNDVAVSDFISKGYLPEAIVNFAAFLGWNPGTDKEIFTLNELIGSFSLNKVSKSGAFFNVEKLDWYNREYLKNISKNDFITGLKKYSSILNIPNYDENMLSKICNILKERISKYSDIDIMIHGGDIQYFFNKPILEKVRISNNGCDINKTLEYLNSVVSIFTTTKIDWNSSNIKDAIWDYASKKGRGDVLWPFRYALSGKNKSPDPFVLAEVFGFEETISRLNIAIKTLNE